MTLSIKIVAVISIVVIDVFIIGMIILYKYRRVLFSIANPQTQPQSKPRTQSESKPRTQSESKPRTQSQSQSQTQFESDTNVKPIEKECLWGDTIDGGGDRFRKKETQTKRIQRNADF